MVKLNQIYHEDCLSFMDKLISSRIKVDVIVTSPPYNLSKDYGNYKDNLDKCDYLSWLKVLSKKSMCILQDSGSFFLNIGSNHLEPTLPFEIAMQFTDISVGFTLQNIIHWIKSISIDKDDIGKSSGLSKEVSIGHFKPIASKRYLSDLHEYIFHFTKTGKVNINKFDIGVPYQDKSNITRWKSSKDLRDRGNVWFIPYSTIHKGRPHPAVFPSKLPYLCIKLHGVRHGMIVYDPFMGIGSTAIACKQLNVNYLGTETNDLFIQQAIMNINSA